MNPLALQTAVFAQLSAALDAMLPRAVAPDGTVLSSAAVYDHAPQQAGTEVPFPYVVVGDDTAFDFDTDTSIGSEATITIHVWSRFRGRSEVKTIQQAIYNALHRAPLSVAGRHLVDCMWEYAETILEADGLTRHGIVRFRVLTEEL